MNKFIRLFLAFVIVLLIVELSYSQPERKTTKVGTTIAQFLKIPAGSRSIGMGGSAAAVEGDIYSIYWNPGALAKMKTPGEVSFNQAQWIADIDYSFVAAGLTIDDFGTLGFSVTSVSTPEEVVRTEINPDGDGRRWKYNALAMGLSFARSLTDRFSIGFTAKYIREGIWNMSSQGFAFDIGTIYTTNFNDLKIGASISNFGSKMRLEGHNISFNTFPEGEQGQGAQNVESIYKTDSYDIPLTFRIGLAMDILRMENIRVTGAIDATHPNDNAEYINTGVEFAFNELFFARAGYKSLLLDETEEGLTWGVGLNFPVMTTTGVKLDYAFADFGRLKDVQYLTVSITY
ncbi:MAG: PorV/PorQ family protein [Bacteroidota bacterium]|nr:PorV/PorQ family protein [Bacteroidota bacterium]